jgi:hypothetical protein
VEGYYVLALENAIAAKDRKNATLEPIGHVE